MIIETRQQAIILIACINILATKNTEKGYKWSINKDGKKVLMFHFTAMDLKLKIKKEFKEDFTVRDIGFVVRSFSYKQKKTTTSITYKSKPVNGQGYHFTEQVVKMICDTVYSERVNSTLLRVSKVRTGIIDELFRD